MGTFRRRSRLIMLTIWKSLVQSKLDYTSQLWSPSDQASISELESVARHFTSKIDGMAGLEYWERLHSLHLYSQKKRRERYLIIFLWKVAQGLVQGHKATFHQHIGRGRFMSVLDPTALRWLLIPLDPIENHHASEIRKAKYCYVCKYLFIFIF